MNEQTVPVKITNGPLTVSVGDSRFSTPNTKLAVALMTVGALLKRYLPITNHYTSEVPATRYNQGEPGWRPGIVTFHFEVQDNTAMSIAPLVEGFDTAKADSELDELFKALEAKVREDKHLDASLIAIVDTIRKRFRPAVMVYIRRALENRERIVKRIKNPSPEELVGDQKMTECLMIKRGEGFVLIDKDAPDKTKREMGLL